MKWTALLGVVLTLSFTACGSTSKKSSADHQLQREADYYAIDQIEKTWHRAASTQNVDLMMSIWANDATFTIGPDTLDGKKQIRDFFNSAGPFQPGHHWVSDTPSYKIRITINGDKGTLYFECHYIDAKTGKLKSVVGADQDVQRINGKWLITSAAGSSPKLG
jgi:ketosteroid isomerase-like protein